MTFIDDKGNTKLSVINGKVVAQYNNKQFDLFSYGIEVDGFADDWVGWVTTHKNYLLHPFTTPWGRTYNYYAEVINNTGILVWEHLSPSKLPEIYQVYEFDLDDAGALKKWFFQAPNNNFSSYTLSNSDYPQDDFIEKPPSGSFNYWKPLNHDINYEFPPGQTGTYSDFLREFSAVLNPADGNRKFFSTNSFDYQFFDLGNQSYGIRPDTGGTIDPLTGISSIQFIDKFMTVETDIKGVFHQVTGLNTDSGKMFRLYNAAFARFPDADGLRYWIGNFSSGIDDERAVSSSFLASAEFKERYGSNISNEKYVETLYLNVLNRELDQGGYDYWVGNLNNGVEERHEVLLGFSESAENKLLFTDMTGFG